ncbi:DUF4214 domain-containing protein [Flavobacterium sp.]|jgi:hypothetical protein|uniref:DUF4214 domain-containing protein n=1 Tax=Flavobacterium sp. TaxID=239 RepID=UPI0037C0164F
MGYTEKRYGQDNLWNMEAWVDPNPLAAAQIMITAHGPNVIDSSFSSDGYNMRVVVTGVFKYDEPAITGAQVRGWLSTQTIYKEGILSEYREYDTPVDIQLTINPTFDTRLSWLSGNDLFVGSNNADLSDKVQSLAGNDTFIGYGSSQFYDQFYGGEGIDTAVYQGSLSEYRINATSFADRRTEGLMVAGFEVWDNTRQRDGTDLLHEVERLQFTDLNLALDTAKGEVAGSAYRLYKAAFDRTPDAEGLGFWIASLDSGIGLNTVAQGFINSAEFKAMYGANATDEHFVSLLYKHVLHRVPEGEGYQFWVDGLEGGASRAQVLKDFSESTENINQTAGLIANGIQYEAWS